MESGAVSSVKSNMRLKKKTPTKHKGKKLQRYARALGGRHCIGRNVADFLLRKPMQKTEARTC